MSKLNRSIWLLPLLSIFGLFSPVAASAFSSAPNSFAYGEQNQAGIAYDAGSLTEFSYDSAAVRVADEKEIRAVEAGSLFADFARFLAAEGTASRLGSLTPAQARQIQAFSERFGAEVNVVGSRAAGTAGPFSDFDYVVGGNAKLRHAAENFLPRNPQSVMGTEGGNLIQSQRRVWP